MTANSEAAMKKESLNEIKAWCVVRRDIFLKNSAGRKEDGIESEGAGGDRAAGGKAGLMKNSSLSFSRTYTHILEDFAAL